MSAELVLGAKMGSSYGLDVRFSPLSMCIVDQSLVLHGFVTQDCVMVTWPAAQPIRPGLCVHDGSKKRTSGTH